MKNELKDGLLNVSASIKAVMPLLAENPVDLNLVRMEKKYIIAAMKLYSGVKQEAANALGISVITLINKMKKYKITREDL